MVGQANTDAREAEKQVSKGLEDLRVIVEELQNLPTLDDQAVDRFQESLNKAENDLIAVGLDGKIKSLTEAKNNHQRWMKQYEDEHHHLIYTDDILTTPQATLALYADDAAYITKSLNTTHAAYKMQRALDLLPDWLAKWRLSVNVVKTQAIATGSVRLPPPLKF